MFLFLAQCSPHQTTADSERGTHLHIAAGLQDVPLSKRLRDCDVILVIRYTGFADYIQPLPDISSHIELHQAAAIADILGRSGSRVAVVDRINSAVSVRSEPELSQHVQSKLEDYGIELFSVLPAEIKIPAADWAAQMKQGSKDIYVYLPVGTKVQGGCCHASLITLKGCPVGLHSVTATMALLGVPGSYSVGSSAAIGVQYPKLDHVSDLSSRDAM